MESCTTASGTTLSVTKGAAGSTRHPRVPARRVLPRAKGQSSLSTVPQTRVAVTSPAAAHDLTPTPTPAPSRNCTWLG